MKTIGISFIVGLLAFAAGLYFGYERSRQAQQEASKRFYLRQSFAASSLEVQLLATTLSEFRINDPTEGMTMLEKWLDGSLLKAVACDRDLNNGTNSGFGFIQIAYEYRKKYPWTNSTPEISSKVQAVFSRIR